MSSSVSSSSIAIMAPAINTHTNVRQNSNNRRNAGRNTAKKVAALNPGLKDVKKAGDNKFDMANIPIPEDLLLLTLAEYKNYSSWYNRVKTVLAIQQKLHPKANILPSGRKEMAAVLEEARRLGVYINTTVRSFEQSLCHDKSRMRKMVDKHDNRDIDFSRLPHVVFWEQGSKDKAPEIMGIIVQIQSGED